MSRIVGAIVQSRRRAAGSLLVLLLSALATFAQTTADGTTPKGAMAGAPAGSYGLSGFENVNLYSGNLNFSLPLVGVSGRGGARTAMNLSIDSTRWDVNVDRDVEQRSIIEGGSVYTITDTRSTFYCTSVRVVDEEGTPSTESCEETVRYDNTVVLDGRVISEVITGGGTYWSVTERVGLGRRPGYGPGVLQGVGAKFGGRYSTYVVSLTRLTFIGPDGTEYELKDTATDGEPKYHTPSTPVSRGTVFVSSNGEAITFVSDAEILDVWHPISLDGPKYIYPSGYLYFADGTRYRINEGRVEWIRDSNGNLVSFEYDADNRVIKTTDSLNRQVTVSYNIPSGAPDETYDEISFRGANGEPRSVKIYRGKLSAALRPDFTSTLSPAELFPELPLDPGEDYDPSGVVNRVVLPNEREYRLFYDQYNELARVELPTGGAIEYDYALPTANVSHIHRGVRERRVYSEGNLVTHLGGQLDGRQEYSSAHRGALPGPYYTDVTVKHYDHTAGGGGLVNREVHSFNGQANRYTRSFYAPWREGLEYQTETFDADGTPLRRVEQEWEQRAPARWVDPTQPEKSPSNNPRVKSVTTTMLDVSPNLVSKQVVAYDDVNNDFNNQKDVWEYDYGPGQPGALLRHTSFEYLTAGAYTGAPVHMRRLVKGQTVFETEGAERPRARTTYEYDNYTPDAGSNNRHAALIAYGDIFGMCTTHDAAGNCANEDPASYTTRGNVTGVTSYLLDKDGNEVGSVTANRRYDIAGNVVKAIDARVKPDGGGNETAYDFSDNFGEANGSARDEAPPAPLGSSQSYALPTKVANALGHVTHTQYDYHTGQLVNTEDANGTVTRMNYGQGDRLDRLTQVVYAANYPDSPNNVRSQATFLYDDIGRKSTATSDLKVYGDNLLKSESFYDGLGRTAETRQYEGATQYVATLTKYDALGRAAEVSNPFRPLAQPAEVPVWTATEYDALGRVTVLTTKADGAKVYTLYDGARTMVTDQAGLQRVSKTDALGRLTDVWEVRAADAATEQVSFPVPQGFPHPAPTAGYRTGYGYDVLGNLRRVEQGAQRRHFAYDSLGRLLRASNPEQEANVNSALPANMLNWPADSHNAWSLAYEYDEAGNLKKRTDARGVETSYSYDVLNRITDRGYTDVNLPQDRSVRTPPVKYFYDEQALPAGAPAFSRGKSVGRLVGVTYGGGASTTGGYTGDYDELGRPRYSAQVTALPDAAGQLAPQAPYVFGYEYNLDGSLRSETYPSGRVIESAYDATGRLAGVKKRGGDYYAGGDPAEPGQPNVISYTAHGAVAALRLGNGLWEHTSYNLRFQPEVIGLGTSRTDSSKLKLEYGYVPTIGGAAYPARNNWNVQTQRISVPAAGAAPAQTFTQTYTYDTLNRLETAGESNGTATTWAQVYTYDRYGNRRLDKSQTTMPNLAEPNPTAQEEVANPTIQPQTNRITEDQNVDGNKEYTYDKAGNLTCDALHCAPAPSPAPYFDYDAENKIAHAGGGHQVGGASYEYDGGGQRVKKVVGTVTTVFVYDMAGRLAAEYSDEPTQAQTTNTSYLTQDVLGSTRVVTDEDGEVASRHDYLPFGEELPGETGGRAAAAGYTGEGLRQMFTGYQRDEESGLDYAENRYFSPMVGRYTSIDPMSIQGRHLPDPQNLNRYAYVNNNPLKYVDPDALEKIILIIRTFIPSETIKDPFGNIYNGNVDAQGNRKPGPDGYKTEQWVEFDTDDGKNNVLYHNFVGVTYEYDSNGKVIGTGHADGATLKLVVTRNGHGDVTVEAKGDEVNPLAPGPQFMAPGITFDFDINVQSDGSHGDARVSLTGQHDGFPAYEVIVVRPESGNTSTTVYSHNPTEAKQTPWSLAGSGEYYPKVQATIRPQAPPPPSAAPPPAQQNRTRRQRPRQRRGTRQRR